MSEQAEQGKIKPWKWPGEWMKDEKFWRDVATRTASGILVVAISYLFAVFMGYIQNPGLWNSLGAFISSVAFTGGLGAVAGIAAAVGSFLVHRVTMTQNEKELRQAKREARKKKREDIEELAPTN